MDPRKQLIQQLMQSQGGGGQPSPDMMQGMGGGQQMPPQMPQQPPQAGQQGMGGMISIQDLASSGILSEEQIMQLVAKAGM